MIVYLSGPMSGLPDYNYPAFQEVADRLTRNGIRVVSPTQIGQHDGWTWEQAEAWRALGVPQVITHRSRDAGIERFLCGDRIRAGRQGGGVGL